MKQQTHHHYLRCVSIWNSGIVATSHIPFYCLAHATWLWNLLPPDFRVSSRIPSDRFKILAIRPDTSWGRPEFPRSRSTSSRGPNHLTNSAFDFRAIVSFLTANIVRDHLPANQLALNFPGRKYFELSPEKRKGKRVSVNCIVISFLFVITIGYENKFLTIFIGRYILVLPL